jgi:hypothetical protein
MQEKYNPKARLAAFIFIEDKLYVAKTHTDCIIQFLIDKKLVKNERQFFNMLNGKIQKHKDLIASWSAAIEKCSIFGEFSFYEKNMALFVFDDINQYGLECLKPIVYANYGDIPIYYAKYNIEEQTHFQLIKLS